MKKCIIIIFSLIFSICVSAQEITMDQLLARVIQLENRVDKLENQLATNKSIGNSISNDKLIWRNLKKGMDQDTVRKLLGEPITINSLGITHWYYTKSLAYGFVIFDDDNKVYGWSEPE